MPAPLSPLQFFRRAADVYGDRPAVADGAERYTYAVFADRCLRLAAALREIGLGPGDRAAVLAPNTHRALECYTAVPLAGGVLVPLNTRLGAADYRHIAGHAGCRVLLADPAFADLAGSLRDDFGLRVVTLDDNAGAGTAGGGGAVSVEDLIAGAPSGRSGRLLDGVDTLDENAPISINYTSGTSGHAKGVIMTHRMTALNVLDVLVHARLGGDDVYLHTLPMFHVNGWGGVWAVTAAGARHVCLPHVDPPAIVRLIEAEGVTVAFAAPTVLVMLGGDPSTQGWRPRQRVRWYVGGAPPPAALIKRCEEELGFEIVHVYGLTETGPWLTVCEWRAAWDDRPLAERAALKARQGIGQIAAGRVRIVRDDLADVARDGVEIGEIVVRGPTVTAGYYRDPEATAAATAGGWFHTGDLAVVHPDGYAQIVDRKKDLIISGGENISSVEVEGVLYQHPAVLEAAVVASPDPVWGEVPRACVVLRSGARATAGELIAFCRERLAHFKAPKAVEFVDALPKTATGKIQKYLLRTRADAAEAPAPSAQGRRAPDRAGGRDAAGGPASDRGGDDAIA
ncbi:MAG TPA: long-chain-fatty-acid--CoA ligase [bacterium]|nr:long-chain-fatty-acid--CoA ligase [bacterium]